MAMRTYIASWLLVLVAALALGACGESKQDKAQSTVCDARADIGKQVEAANKTFTSQLQSIAASLGSSTSLSEARSQLTSALQQLATAYKQSFAGIDCS
jgi:hypothetical protein